MHLTIKGLVVRATAYNDTDTILTLLTADHGKLSAKARGLRRKNSPLTAACQLLAYGEFTLFEYRGNYTVNEASAIALFQPLRNDLSKLSLGTYFAQAAEIVSQEDSPNPEILSLVLNCLYALSDLDISERLVKSVFELRLACLAGYEPDLSGCYRCGNSFPEHFDLSEGHLECAKCRNIGSDGIRMPVSPGAISAMRYICACDAKRLFSFENGERSAEQLANLSESYLSTQLERGFSALDFYKSIVSIPECTF